MSAREYVIVWDDGRTGKTNRNRAYLDSILSAYDRERGARVMELVEPEALPEPKWRLRGHGDNVNSTTLTRSLDHARAGLAWAEGFAQANDRWCVEQSIDGGNTWQPAPVSRLEGDPE